MKQSQRVAKNVLASGLATAFGGGLQTVSVLLVARWVTVAEFGIYSFLLAFSFVISRLADMGVSNILIRDLAVEPERLGELLGQTLALGWVIIGSAICLLLVAVPIVPFDRGLIIATALMCVSGLLQFPSNCYSSALRSQEDNEIQAGGIILQKMCVLMFTACALQMRATLPALAAAQAAANVVQWIFYRQVVTRIYVRPRLAIAFPVWKYLLVSAIPLGAAAVIRLLAEQSDILILTWLRDPHSVGLFSGPYRLTAGLRFIPQSIIIALFPLFSKAVVSAEHSKAFHEAYVRGIKSLIVMGAPIAVMYVCSPECLSNGLLGLRYHDAAPALRILGAGILLLFIASPYPYLLTALNLQRVVLTTSLLALVLRVSLDVVLISWLGFIGPCVSMLVSESVLIGSWMFSLWRAGYSLDMPQLIWRPALASIAMGVALASFPSRTVLTLLPSGIAAMIIYFTSLFLLGAFTSEELKLVRESFGFARAWMREFSAGAIQGRT